MHDDVLGFFGLLCTKRFCLFDREAWRSYDILVGSLCNSRGCQVVKPEGAGQVRANEDQGMKAGELGGYLWQSGEPFDWGSEVRGRRHAGGAQLIYEHAQDS